MSILSAVTSGKQIGAQIHTVFGKNGVGKTTFAASFPSPLILDLEDGSKHLDVARLGSDKLGSVAKVRETLAELVNSSHDFKTVTIDSAESLEALIYDAVCAEGKVASIELYDGGYGKGYTRGREIMRDVMNDLKLLQAKGITTIIVGHSVTKSHTDPTTNQTYDRDIMRLNDKMAAVIRDLSDNVLFATYKVFTTQDKGKTKAFGDGQRILLTQWRPGFDAKNRLELPLELPLSYDAFVEACGSSSTKPEDLVADIQAMSEKLDETLKKDVSAMLEKFKTNPTKLREVKNRLMKYVA
jgi:hypothetical protein